jgi:hypothetical protein
LERFIYTNDEANQLNELIHLAKQFDIHFIYPLNTLGQWFQSLTIDNGEQEEMFQNSITIMLKKHWNDL